MTYEGKANTMKQIASDSGFYHKGVNALQVGVRNRLLVLRAIALVGPISRVELASQLGLTKTTLGNIVSELIANGLVCETGSSLRSSDTAALGRRPVSLQLSEEAPCIAGIQINRQYITGIIAGLDGKCILKRSCRYVSLNDSNDLMQKVYSVLDDLFHNTNRFILAIGVACVGPVQVQQGMILNPSDFYGIHDLPICSLLETKYNCPCCLIHDANAGALAEKIYGREKQSQNFMYLVIDNGIGAGYILDNRLHIGNIGQSGEIGHSSINYSGPKCSCGNVGCLEMYANISKLNEKIHFLQKVFEICNPGTSQSEDYSFPEILHMVDRGDFCAITALDEFCEYLATAIINTIRFLDISRIVIGYEGESDSHILEQILEKKILNRVSFSAQYPLSIHQAYFGTSAPLYGAIAQIAELIFEGHIGLPKMG